MGVVFTNNAETTLAAAISSTSATSISVSSSSSFPSLAAGEYFYATVDDGTNHEIVKVTGISGTTWTVVRAADNTTARTIANGSTVQLRATSALLTDIQENIAAKSANQTVFSATAASNATAYNVGVDPGVEANASIFLDGVYQNHDTFSFDASTVTFDAAPTNGTKIEIVVDNLINLQSSNLTTDTFTATSGQTAFTLSDAPAAENNLLVFIEGAFQDQGNYSISNHTLTLATGAVEGRTVTVYIINPVNIGTPSDNTVTSAKLSGNITTPGTLTVGSHNVSFDSPTFVVDHSNSRVGLGTSTPSVPVDIVGEVKISSHLNLPDNAIAKFGTGGDLEIFHDASNSYIDETGTGNLYIKSNSILHIMSDDIRLMNAANSETILKGVVNGAVKLFHDNVEKLETTSAGVTVTGTMAKFQRTGGAVAAAVTYVDASTDIEFGTTTNHALSLTTNDTRRLTINNAGNAAFSNHVDLLDNMELRLGTGNDYKFDYNGSRLNVIGTGDAVLDISGNFYFDTDAGNIYFQDGGSQWARFENDNGNLTIRADTSDKDINFVGRDGSSPITALSLDMSAAGIATFNNGVKAGADVAAFGANTGSSANRMAMSMEGSGVSRLICNGADGSTVGTFEVFTAVSGGTGSVKLGIDAAGDVLIGQTSQTGYAFAQKLVVGDGDNNDGITIQSGATHQGNLAFNHSDATTAHGRILYQHNTNYMAFFTNNVEKLRIDTAGNLNIGGTSSGGVPKVNLFHNDSLRAFISATSAAGMLLDSDGKMSFNTNNSSRWHIQSSGHLTPNNQHSYDIGATNAEVRNIYAQGLFIGKSSASINLAGFYVAPNDFMAYTNTGTDDGDRCLVLNRQNSNGLILDFKTSNSLRGSISFDGSNMSYGGTSDYRLKENIEPMQKGLDRLNKLKPVSFDWKESGIKSEGFIAHEVQEVFPQVVVGKKDGKEMQQMDYGRITPLLVKAIQELSAQVEELKKEIQEMKSNG